MVRVSNLPRMQDVADAAKVSVATVSRYLNHPPRTPGPAQIRVSDAIRRLGFIPDRNASSLASRRSNVVVLLAAGLSVPGGDDALSSQILALSDGGFDTILSLAGHVPISTARLDLLRACRPEAIVMVGVAREPNLTSRLPASGVTIVEVGQLPTAPIDLAIGHDPHDAAVKVAAFLCTRGYRRAHLAAHDGAGGFADSFARSWCEAGHSIPTRSRLGDAHDASDGRLVFRDVCALSRKPDVIVCGSDWTAQGLLVEARNAGIRVPDELAITGLGDLPIASEMRPGITTIDVGRTSIARLTLAALERRRREGPDTCQRIDTGCTVIARGSA